MEIVDVINRENVENDKMKKKEEENDFFFFTATFAVFPHLFCKKQVNLYDANKYNVL